MFAVTISLATMALMVADAEQFLVIFLELSYARRTLSAVDDSACGWSRTQIWCMADPLWVRVLACYDSDGR